MKELVVISGKGGTGKTSLAASFATLAEDVIIADCDVDAANLHILLSPQIKERHPFSGGKRAQIITEKCTQCQRCISACQFNAIQNMTTNTGIHTTTVDVDPVTCEGCGVCAWVCPEDSIAFKETVNGEWYISDTKYGTLIHAKLGIAESNSGKLVTLIKNKAIKIAEKQKCKWIIVDGSPGLGCPVIASISGADVALIVTEPTPSGAHDLNRIAKLLHHFSIPAMYCINKYDINPAMSQTIQKEAEALGIAYGGNIPFDENMQLAQINKQPVITLRENSTTHSIKALWQNVNDFIFKANLFPNQSKSAQRSAS